MSLRHLCRYDFEVACFGHGPPIRRAAANRFRQRWGPRDRRRDKDEPCDSPVDRCSI